MGRKRKKKDIPDYYIADRIIGTRKNEQGETEYLIKWRDYDESENSWVPAGNICDPLLFAQAGLEIPPDFKPKKVLTRDVIYPPRRFPRIAADEGEDKEKGKEGQTVTGSEENFDPGEGTSGMNVILPPAESQPVSENTAVSESSLRQEEEQPNPRSTDHPEFQKEIGEQEGVGGKDEQWYGDQKAWFPWYST